MNRDDELRFRDMDETHGYAVIERGVRIYPFAPMVIEKHRKRRPGLGLIAGFALFVLILIGIAKHAGVI